MTTQISGNVVLLASEDGDFGLVSADGAHDQAAQLASEEGVTIYLRDPLTDEVIEAVERAASPG